jgi:hypothetical protein
LNPSTERGDVVKAGSLRLVGFLGYSSSDLAQIQTQWRIRFPPDLVDLLRTQRPLIGGPGSFDWLLSDPSYIQERFDWPFDGFWFDIEHNDLWWPEWGDKPSTPAEQRARLKEVLAGVPKLIPLFGHRYLPAEPFESGSPVFSVYQSDIICYGANLQDWIERERGSWGASLLPPLKEIPFWSEAMRKNNEPP